MASSSDFSTRWASKTGAPPPAAYDLRSDVVTTPTTAMLSAISNCTLLDDVFLEDPTTKSLEAFIASLTGKEDSLLVMSGTMGNQVAIRAHLGGPPHSILCDNRCHILCWEAGATATWTGALVQGILPKNGTHLTLGDIQRNAITDDDVHSCPTRLISLENTLNGMVLPLSECQRISAWAKEHDIAMHLDGARLWEAVAAGKGSLKEYVACFDTVSLCFSKGLGAPIGSIVVGNEAFIKRARHIRKMFGGGLRQAGVVSSAARIAVEETFLGGLLERTHKNALRVAQAWKSHGGQLTHPVETNMVWLDLAASGVSDDDFIRAAETKGLRTMGGRLVIHYQIGDNTLRKLEDVFTEVCETRQVLEDVPIRPVDMKINVE